MQTNRRAEKLTAARTRFTSCRMLDIPTWQPRIPYPVPSDDDEDQSGEAEEGVIYNEVFLAQTHGMPIIIFSLNKTNHLGGSSELPTQPPRSWSEDRPLESP